MSEPHIDPFALAYLAQYPLEAAQILPTSDVPTVAKLLGESMPPLRAEQIGALLAALPTSTGADILALLPKDIAAAVLPTLSVPEIAEIVTALSAVTSRRLLSVLRPAELAAVRRTLNYATGSVGKHMQTRTIVLPKGISVAEARTRLPGGGEDGPEVAFILDNRRHVRGIVPLNKIAAASDAINLDVLILPAPPTLKASQQLNEVRKLPHWREHRYLPVVGMQSRFLGVLERADLFAASLDTTSPADDPDTDPIDILLDIAETIWIPLVRLFGRTARPLHPYHRSVDRSNDKSR